MAFPGAANPFRHQLFRVLWGGTAVSNIGIWMQTVGAVWLMATLTPSVPLVALVQTATSLPGLVFGLPAGALADRFDRRRLLLLTQAGMFACAATMAALVRFHLLGPFLLLALTFLLGSCSALSSTVRQASVSDVVPKNAMVAALGWSGIAYNGARALGPALAGAVLAAFGTSAVFFSNAALFGAVLVLQATRYHPPAQAARVHETAFVAMKSGLVYVRHATVLHGHLIRSSVFVGAASSLWALLPVVARQHPAFGAGGYALLLGSLGAGAVASGFLLGPLRARFSLDALVNGAGAVFAASTLAAALLDHLPTLCLALAAGGAAWVLNNSSINAAFQTSLPAWVRARALSIRLLVFQGALALGSALWGLVASEVGVTAALVAAALLTLLGQWATARYPIALGTGGDTRA